MLAQIMGQGTCILFVYAVLANGTIVLKPIEHYKTPFECAFEKKVLEHRHPDQHYTCSHVQPNQEDQKAHAKR